ncbi:maleylpyruvate isomerase family mycothiol-dependent enzyme [Saccharothrix syringae]|uniref:maleylpyruvate isomerase family mycothiol-dependent enzyme n=1 Tax=Saccharothrix syringae TaxID=103733 RepID=UPI00068ED24E|nr:maleylpyruvate isomerase family mycothiol-dependent enzyme [Saccharothrix syringae]
MTTQATALAGYTRLTELIADLTDAQVAEPSALPGWTRGHVLAHLTNLTAAMARQAELEGTPTEVYDGGQAGRDAAIEAAAGRSADEHRAALAAAVERLTAAWAGVRDWGAPVAYRSGTLLTTVHAVWREVQIHALDLDLGPVTWSTEFCEHTIDFLAPRVPDGVRLVLVADGRRWELGEGEEVELRGSLQDLTAWLAGREPAGEVAGPEVALAPWPSAAAPAR